MALQGKDVEGAPRKEVKEIDNLQEDVVVAAVPATGACDTQGD